ncbi:MAG: DegT/DnrJ/EryC1/StrS family aminotransferase [Salinivirgaceae bacterium]|jgi:dTDP-4-amino-4,6-dideoxygalactose transaminase|nr:DegT/DnrJ/EryC1/StrS family aminotransferase [Salinivirgaceae bacterium]
MKKKGNIYVTEPSLPDLEEYTELLKTIWESKQITNNGELHKRFEQELQQYLNVKHISLFSNGTLALMTALKALRITGEVITTPYSFVATTHSLHWNGIKPVFCDINPHDGNINPDKIEALITPQTTAIMPVHVYGNPCDNEKIQRIADVYGLKIIYDAAHAFGVEKGNESILNWGDLSVLSFHATKTFNTVEGGAIVTKDEKLKKRLDYFKNFGFANETTVIGYGINAKMNELISAYGLLQLHDVDKNIILRKEKTQLYRQLLQNIKGIRLLDEMEDVRYNYTYFPVFIENKQFGKSRDSVYEELKQNGIYARRYFYPLISDFPAYRGLPSAQKEHLPEAGNMARQVLCLPLYADLENRSIERIVEIIRRNAETTK